MNQHQRTVKGRSLLFSGSVESIVLFTDIVLNFIIALVAFRKLRSFNCNLDTVITFYIVIFTVYSTGINFTKEQEILVYIAVSVKICSIVNIVDKGIFPTSIFSVI